MGHDRGIAMIFREDIGFGYFFASFPLFWYILFDLFAKLAFPL